MKYKYLPEIIKLNQQTRELKDLTALKSVPATKIWAPQIFWVAQKPVQRGGQRWFDHQFRPATRLFWKNKTMSI